MSNLIFVTENIFKGNNIANHSAKILIVIVLVSWLMGSNNQGSFKLIYRLKLWTATWREFGT